MRFQNKYVFFFFVAIVLVTLEGGNVLGKRIGSKDKLVESSSSNKNESPKQRSLQQTAFQFRINLDGILIYVKDVLNFEITTGYSVLLNLLDQINPDAFWANTEAMFTTCFSSSTTADVKGRGDISMSDVQVGDEVLTSKGKYEVVYAIDHRHPSKSAKFIQINAKAGEKPLELTETHMLYLEGNPNPVPASAVQVGDQVQTLSGPQEVKGIKTVTRKGIFNPLTSDGTIVASGIISSTYSAHFSNNEFIEIGGLNVMSHHKFFHTLLKPYKYFCTGVSLEFCKTSEERVLVSQVAKNIYSKLQQENNEMIRGIFLLCAVLCLHILDFSTSPFGLTLMTAAVGWLVVKKNNLVSKRKET